MLARIGHALTKRVMVSPLLNRTAARELHCDQTGGHPVCDDAREHLLAALAWLERAQDATPDDGVARSYSVAWNPHFESRGWRPSYPETTGYIIPTLFDAARYLDSPKLRERAIRMADWEIEVQLDSGAVQGGVINHQSKPTPAVFNTGQVILGWVRAYRETQRAAYLDAANRAADYLLDVQDSDGSFCKGRSDFARTDCTTYYSRVAWPLCMLGKQIEEPRYVEAGMRGIDFALTKQRPNGWWADNCLSDRERPLLHTIAYATRGVLEAGILLNRDDYIEAAKRTAGALAKAQRRTGGLAGRFADDWTEAARWECLTGNAQTAIIWWKLAELTGDAELEVRARHACRMLMSTQNRTAPDPGLAGGIKGSYPLDGDYGRFEVLNWATKFFVDAMLLTLPAVSPERRPEVAS
jgi:hypothetical protein